MLLSTRFGLYRLIGMFFLLICFFPVVLHAEEELDFTNEAGQPILAIDMESTTSETPPWVEGHRWDTPPSFQLPREEGQRVIKRAKKRPLVKTTLTPDQKWFDRFLLIFFIWTGLVHILLGTIVYFDVRKPVNRMLWLWIPVVLLAGLPAIAVYVLWKWVKLKEIR